MQDSFILTDVKKDGVLNSSCFCVYVMRLLLHLLTDFLDYSFVGKAVPTPVIIPFKVEENILPLRISK